MPKVHAKTKSTRGESYRCDRCTEPIKATDRYYEWKFRYGGTHRQHASHGTPRASQLTQSKMSGVYAAVESAQDAIANADCPEDIASALNDAASEVESVKDEYQSSLDNMPEPLQQGDTGQQIQERIDNLDSFVSELQRSASDIEDDSFDDEEPKVSDEHESPCPKLDADGQECTCGKDDTDTEHDEWSETRDAWIEGLRQQATDALDSLQD